MKSRNNSSANNWISGYEAGKRMDTFIKYHCQDSLYYTCLKSLKKHVHRDVPRFPSGEGHAKRYSYHEDSLGEAIYNWYETVYPDIVSTAKKLKTP